jgi:hypothetical protein
MRMKPASSIAPEDGVAYSVRSVVRKHWFCSSSRSTPLFTRQMVVLDSRFVTVALGTSRPVAALHHVALVSTMEQRGINHR